MFTKMAKSSQVVTESSYVGALEMIRRSKPFSGEFVKGWLLIVDDIVFPEQKKKVQEISLSNDTFRDIRQVEHLGSN